CCRTLMRPFRRFFSQVRPRIRLVSLLPSNLIFHACVFTCAQSSDRFLIRSVMLGMGHRCRIKPCLCFEFSILGGWSESILLNRSRSLFCPMCRAIHLSFLNMNHFAVGKTSRNAMRVKG